MWPSRRSPVRGGNNLSPLPPLRRGEGVPVPPPSHAGKACPERSRRGARGLGLVLAAALLLAACGGSSGGERALTVFAAASLSDALGDAARAFERANSGTRVTVNFANTVTLRTQLEQGARADVFASADEAQMALAQRSGVVAGEPAVLATNRLAVVARAEGSKVAALEDVAKPGVRLMIVPAPIPVGVYFEDALRRMEADPRYGGEFVRRVRANVVSQAQNVRQATATVQLGEADAAIAYVTDARAQGGPTLRAIPFPDGLADVARYPIAVVKASDAAELARRFIAFLRSPEGQGVLARHGFGSGG